MFNNALKLLKDEVMQRFFLPFFLTGTMIMVFVMGKTGAPLKTTATPNGILNLEFAYNKVKVQEVVDAWTFSAIHSTDNIRVAQVNTWWDFIFLFFYAPLLFLLLKKISARFSQTSHLHKIARLLTIPALLAGALDIIENFGMLQSLGGNISTGIALITFIPSLIKWLLVVCIIAFLLYAIPTAFLTKKDSVQIRV